MSHDITIAAQMSEMQQEFHEIHEKEKQ